MNQIKRKTARRSAGVLALAAAVAVGGCVDTELQGVIVEEDVRDETLMLPLVRGINSELTDNFYDFDGTWWITGSATDDFNNDGVATSEEVYEVGEYQERPGDFAWEQAHEAAWAGYYGVSILEDVLGEEEANRSPLTAQSWINSGFAERLLGETFCELVYAYGPGAGPLIGPADDYDQGQVVPSDSALRRSMFAHQQALRVAEAAVAAGAPTPENDPIFDPQSIVYKAHGGIAQAAVLLGDWDLAVEHASQVPDDFAAYAHHNPQVEDNPWYEVSFQNDDFTLWNTPLHRQFEGDPRAPMIRCGDWEDGDAVMTHGSFRDIFDTDLCDAIDGYGGEYRAESNRMPLFASLKSMTPSLVGGETGENADIPLIKGAEMRLIRAEAALRDGQLGEFANQVNAARAIYDMEPIETPTTAGALEYPNAEDDAWSILDRERYLTLHLEGRRLADMRRWQHPYISGGHMVNTRVLEDYGPHRQNYCLPIADLECDANPELFCETPN